MLTQDEAELYDRQIRLWGVNAQSRIRQSKVLMLGFNGVASEVAKILTLAGIDSLTIVDDCPLQASDLSSNLFCRPAAEDVRFRTHAVSSKLRRLNPLVKVNIINSQILSVKPEDYKNYDLVTLHNFLSIDETSRINDICRDYKTKFFIVLDFGFFGFLFNDLGHDFKYTYEDYLAEEKPETQSGKEKDPISIEENPADEDGDIGYESSDNEYNRPKKRLRVHSPNRASTGKTDGEKKTQIGTLKYVPFKEMISLKFNSFSKNTSPILLVTTAIYKFYSEFGFLPRDNDDPSAQKDRQQLLQLLETLAKENNLAEVIHKKLPSTWIEHIYGSLSPICAILGGVAGQDMIRALSCKDIPLYNTFSFDGISMNGIVEKVGISSEQMCRVQPVVRDFLVIDDDED